MTPLDVLTQPLWHKTAIVLLHFLWQGTLIAAVVALIVRHSFVSRPEIRYVFCLFGLAAMIAAPLVTCLVVQSPSPAEPGSTALTVKTPEVETVGEDGFEYEGSASVSPVWPSAIDLDRALQQPAREEVSATTTLTGLLVVAQPYFVLCWLVGVFALSGRMLLGFVAVYRFRRRREAVPASLVLTSRTLCRRLGLPGYPEVAASWDIAESFALGFLRPLVLLPAAWLIELPADALEAVIAHELAHIRRRDLWVNLLQRVVEAVLFYHPAVWWLSGRIRAERELCCDLLAVGVTGRRVAYARALEFVARRRVVQRQPVFATGMGGRKMALLDRVRNVLGVKHSEGKLRWWSAGVIALAVPVLLWVVSSAFRPALADDEEEPGGERAAAVTDDEGERGERRDEGERRDADRERGDRERGERDRPDRERAGGERRDADRREGDRPREGRDLSDPDQARDFARERAEDRRRLRDEENRDREREGPERDERELSREELLGIIAELRRELAEVRRGQRGPREGGPRGFRGGEWRPGDGPPRFDRPFEGRPPVEGRDDDGERREGDRPPRFRRGGEGDRPGPRDGEGPPRFRREGDRPTGEERPDAPRGDRPRFGDDRPGPRGLGPEVINLIRELRGEVERLRREVNELRGRRGEGAEREEGEVERRERRAVDRERRETERGERRELETEEKEAAPDEASDEG